MDKVRKESFTRLVGVTELARSTGYSVCHISLVLRGERVPSRTLAAALRRRGYKVGAGPREYRGGAAAKKGGAE
ncbi:MAG: hypothetical protein IJK04_07540 [Kiritimatiellae bacterium]|nr:hypothetical protein [Kiritimatiellia bacterium]